MSDTLFEMTPLRPEPAEKISADRRRTIRQAQALADGAHPLSLAVGYPIRLHPDAPHSADRGASGPRCGTCWYRTLFDHHNRVYPKCTFAGSQGADSVAQDGYPRMSNGAGTDVRRWWPACADYSPGDPSLSPDAARWTAGEQP